MSQVVRDVRFFDPFASEIRPLVAKRLREKPLRLDNMRFTGEYRDGYPEIESYGEFEAGVCERRAMRFENTGNLWLEQVSEDMLEGRVVGPFTSGLVKLDEVARLDVGGQQYRRWKPRVEQLFDGSMEMRHLVLTFDYTSVSDSERREVVRELFKVARRILDGYAVAGLIREEWKIKSKGVSTHFHLACVNRCMSKELAQVWLASIKGEWLIRTNGLGEYVHVEWRGYGTRCVGYLLGYLKKSYVDVCECGGDYDYAAEQMVKYARERYRLRSLRDKGLRKRVGGPLDQLERQSDGQVQYTPEGRGTRTEGVDPRRGAGGGSYRCLMKNNLRPEGSRKWRFVRMFRTGGLV